MYRNIGGKIKTLSVVIALIGVIGSFIAGMVVLSQDAVGVGLCVILVGSLLSWIGSFALYGFGEMIENSAKTAENSARILNLMGGTPFTFDDEEEEDDVEEVYVSATAEEEKQDEEKNQKYRITVEGEERTLRHEHGDLYRDYLGYGWIKIGENEFKQVGKK